jgi:hypothetical protein
MAVRMKMIVLCIAVVCNLVEIYRYFSNNRPDNDSIKYLRNVSTLLTDHTMQQPKGQTTSILFLINDYRNNKFISLKNFIPKEAVVGEILFYFFCASGAVQFSLEVN